MSSSALATPRGRLLDAAFVVATATLALVGFHTAYGGREFLAVGVAGLGIGLLTATATRRQPAVVTVLAGMIAFLAFGGAVVDRATASASFVPTPTVLRDLVHGATAGWADLLTTLPPVGNTGHLLVIPYLCGLAAGLAATTLAWRSARFGLALAPSVVVLALTVLFGTREPASLALQGAVYAAAVVGWAASRSHMRRTGLGVTSRHKRLAGSLVLLSVSAVLALAVGEHLPLAGARDRVILRDHTDPPFDVLDQPSPLAAYRKYVLPDDDPAKVGRDSTLFTVSGLPKGACIRLATMDTYDGVSWRVSAGAGASGSFARVGQSVPDVPAGARSRIEFTVGTYTGVWLPKVGELSSARFGGERAERLADEFRYNAASGTAVVTSGLRAGDRYELDVVVPDVPADLTGLPVAGPLGPTAVVPETVKSRAEGFANGLAQSPAQPNDDGDTSMVTDPYARLRNIEQALQTSGYYSDGAENQEPIRAGHSARRMDEFLDPKSQPIGDGEQYAAAMALMARQLGLPARVVLGFTPSGSGTVEVKGADVSAWVEVDFDGVGWVPFRPTPDPSRTKVEPKAAVPVGQTFEPDVAPPPTIAPQEPDTPPIEDLARTKKEQEQRRQQAALKGTGGGVTTLAVVGSVVVGLPIVLGGVLVATIVGLKQRRRRRRRTRGAPSTRVAAGFLEITDLARDLGHPIPPNATRAEAAAFVGDPASADLAREADAVVFGRERPNDSVAAGFWSNVEAAERSLLDGRSRRVRARARLSLTSLRAQTEAAPS